MTIALLAALLLAAASPADDRPATPVNRRAPDFPASCMPKPGETMAPQKVIVVYTVTTRGAVQDARVRESTDPCFNEMAIAAVRGWRFEPAKANGATVEQADLETTFKFVVGEATSTQDFDASPLKRYPPRYPEWCMDNAESREVVYIEFDVTPEGDTANIRVVDTTNACLNTAAMSAVKKWKYRPKIEDGARVERRGVQTMTIFELFDSSTPPPYRKAVGQRLRSAGADLRRGRDPQEVLADLAELELKYGAKFSRTEIAAFHQLRGAARLAEKDYRGALDDFRVAQKLGVAPDAAKGVADVIVKLEAYIAAEDAGAIAPPDQPGPEEAAPPEELAPDEQS